MRLVEVKIESLSCLVLNVDRDTAVRFARCPNLAAVLRSFAKITDQSRF